jgi:hypothetical protein
MTWAAHSASPGRPSAPVHLTRLLPSPRTTSKSNHELGAADHARGVTVPGVGVTGRVFDLVCPALVPVAVPAA